MLVMVMLIGIPGLILLMVVGGEMGKRVQPQGETEQAETSVPQDTSELLDRILSDLVDYLGIDIPGVTLS